MLSKLVIVSFSSKFVQCALAENISRNALVCMQHCATLLTSMLEKDIAKVSF